MHARFNHYTVLWWLRQFGWRHRVAPAISTVISASAHSRVSQLHILLTLLGDSEVASTLTALGVPIANLKNYLTTLCGVI